jgi:hypothetical protein
MGGRPASARAKSARPKSGRPGSAANKRCVGGDNTAALPFWGVVYGAREAGSAANKRCVGGDNTAALPFWGVVYGAREAGSAANKRCVGGDNTAALPFWGVVYGAREAGWGSGGERVALLAFSVSHPCRRREGHEGASRRLPPLHTWKARRWDQRRREECFARLRYTAMGKVANRDGRVWARRDRKWPLNEGQSPSVRGVRVAPGTGYTRVEGNRRASRNGHVSDIPPENPFRYDSQLFDRWTRSWVGGWVGGGLTQ